MDTSNDTFNLYFKCFLDGPYGTGTREVFDTEHAILVGAGIGITPMASILQSVWYKFSATRKECPSCQHVWLPDENNMKLKKVFRFCFLTKKNVKPYYLYNGWCLY